MKTKMSTYYKLNSNHSTIKKFNKACKILEDMGLSIHFDGSCTVLDDETGKFIDLVDAETNGPVYSFPPSTESKLIYAK